MSKSPASDKTGGSAGDFTPAELPLGVRVADFLLKNAFLILGLATAGGFLALMLASVVPRPYVDMAVVEIGMRGANEPLENPMQSGWRVRGALLEAADDLGVELDARITHRREEKTNALTRFMDVTVSAETASTARTILDRGINRLIAEHRVAHAFEREVMREQLAALERAAVRLEKSIREAPPTYSLPEDELEARAELDALNARVFEMIRSTQALQSLLSDVRTPPTRVVARAAEVELEPSHALIWSLAGIAFGLILGLSLAGARSVMRRPDGKDGANRDPLVESFLSMTSQYRVLILSTTVIATLAAATLGALLRRDYEGAIVAAAAHVEPDGPIIGFHTIDILLETHVERLVFGGKLPEGTGLDAYALRDQPPSSKKLSMFGLRASSQDAISARRAMERALSHLRSLEGPTFESEQRRLERSLGNLDAEVRRLFEGPVTPKTQEALHKAIYERSELKRRLSPIRTYPSRVLAAMPVRQPRREPRMLAFAMIGLVGGVSSGYVMAFFLTAIGMIRKNEQRRAG